MSVQKKKDRVEDLRRQLAAAEEDLTRAVRNREAEPGPGSTVYVTAQFPGSDKVYEYLALRPEGAVGMKRWYITGQAGAQDWNDFMNRIGRAKVEIYQMFF